MTAKKPPKGMSEPETTYRQEQENRSDAEWGAWFKRNADALNASCEEAEAQIARGEYFTLEEVMAELNAQAERRKARKA